MPLVQSSRPRDQEGFWRKCPLKGNPHPCPGSPCPHPFINIGVWPPSGTKYLPRSHTIEVRAPRKWQPESSTQRLIHEKAPKGFHPHWQLSQGHLYQAVHWHFTFCKDFLRLLFFLARVEISGAHRCSGWMVVISLQVESQGPFLAGERTP